MPFGGGIKKLATNSNPNFAKNIIDDPSPHRQQVVSSTLPQGEGYIQNIIKVLEFTITKMNEIEHIASF